MSLRPEEALDNADSYANFVRDVATGRNLSLGERETETFEDAENCGTGGTEHVRRALARAERWNNYAVTNLANPNLQIENLVDSYFGVGARNQIDQILNRYRRVRDRLVLSIHFECESARRRNCRDSTIGYFRFRRSERRTPDELHLCPSWFAINNETEAIRKLYRLVFAAYTGVSPEDSLAYIDLARHLSQLYLLPPSPLPPPESRPFLPPMPPPRPLPPELQ